VTANICQRQPFAGSAFCHAHSKWRSILTGVLPPLLLTLWQNLFMPQLVYRGAQVL
jgi:hypothetical protein